MLGFKKEEPKPLYESVLRHIHFPISVGGYYSSPSYGGLSGMHLKCVDMTKGVYSTNPSGVKELKGTIMNIGVVSGSTGGEHKKNSDELAQFVCDALNHYYDNVVKPQLKKE